MAIDTNNLMRCLAVVCLLGGTSLAHAGPIVFTNEAAWLAAVAGASIATEDFEASPVGVLAVGTTDIGLFDVTIGPVNTGDLNEITTGGFVNGSTELSGFYGNAFGTPPPTTLIDFTFDGPVIGFAADWNSTTSGALLTVAVNGSVIAFGDHLGNPGTGFFGVVDTTPFASISFSTELPPATSGTSGEYFHVDDFQLASAVPEPGTLLILGVALIGIGCRRRLRG